MKPIYLLLIAFGLHAAPGQVTSYELVIDSGVADLAAWQVELRFDAKSARILRIDGSSSYPADIPLAFDHAGLSSGRLTVLSLSTAADLPRGVVTVAHLQLFHRGPAQLTAHPIAAADSAARRIPITLSLNPTQELSP
jgi:hypothetical protein